MSYKKHACQAEQKEFFILCFEAKGGSSKQFSSTIQCQKQWKNNYKSSIDSSLKELMIQEGTGTYKAAPESKDWIEMQTHSEPGIETAETDGGFQKILTIEVDLAWRSEF